MGAQNPSPSLFGANSIATDLQNGFVSSSGALIQQNGPVNYISNGNFARGLTTGWSLGTTGALTNGIPTGTPTFGSGTTNLTLTTAASGQSLAGNALVLTASAATTAGNMMATQAYTIATEDQAKVLTFKFYYSTPSGVTNVNYSGTSSNSFGIALWDATNSVWLSSTANFGMTQGSGTGYVTGTCQTGITTASIQFVVYAANATAGAATLNFTDFFLGPQTAPLGAVVTDWVAYTPTLTGFGTSTGIVFYSRRVGCDLQVNGSFTGGTPTATQAQISLGFNGANANVSVDLSRVSISNLSGKVAASTFGATTFDWSILAPATNATFVNMGIQTSAAPSTTPANGSSMFGAGIVVQVQFSVPIFGWSSGVQMSNDTDTRVISWNGNQTSQSVTASVTDIAFTTVNDRSGSWNGTQFVVPVSGDYFASATYSNTSASSISFYRNGSLYINSGNNPATGVTGSGVNLYTACKAGDTLSLRSNVTGTITVGNFNIFRLSGPAVIAATESVNGRYFSSTSTITSSNSTITYATKDFDSHNAYASGTLTIPVSGKYQMNMGLAVAATFALNGNLQLAVFKNGTQINESIQSAGGVNNLLGTDIADIISCLAGDAITVRAQTTGTAPTVVASNFINYFSWARVGN